MMPVDSEFSSPESQVKVRVRSRRLNRGNQLFHNNNDASTANDNDDDNNNNANHDSTSFAGWGEEELSSTTQDNIESNSEGYDAGLDDDGDDSTGDLGSENEGGDNSTATPNNNNSNNNNESIGNGGSDNNNNNNNNNNNSGNNNEDGTSALGRQHYLVAKLTAVICTHDDCNCNIMTRGLWTPARKTIGNHFNNKNHCWNVNAKPNIRKLERDLKGSQIALHQRAKQNPQQAISMVAAEFPNDCDSFNWHYCDKCGFSTKRNNNFIKHYGERNSYNCIRSLHAKRGLVLCNQFGVIVPQAILQRIKEGTFILPYNTPTASTNNQSTQSTAAPTALTLQPPLPSTPTTQALPSSTFTASPEEMSKATSQSSPTAVNQLDIVHESLQCFINPSKSEEEKKASMLAAKRHIFTFMPLIDKFNPQTFGPKLREMSQHQDSPFNPSTDNTTVRVLLAAGRRWLDTIANFDVIRCTAGHRGRLYQIGKQSGLPNEEALLQGSTFVPSGKMKDIITEFEKLILFLSRSGEGGDIMKAQLMQAETILMSVNISEFENEMDAVKIAADHIVGTNIIPGIILAALLESPHTPNGTNMIGMHIAARSIKAVAGRDHLEFKSGNVIADIANSLLRLTRHAVCSFLVRKADDLNHDNKSNNEFIALAEDILPRVQACYSVDAICKRIRSAREIDQKRLPKVEKGFDHLTREVMVANVTIDHSVWSNAIPTTLSIYEESLQPLFQCTNLLTDVLNPNNKLVLAGADSTVTVVGATGEHRVINICGDIIPTLDASHIEDTQRLIDTCFRCNMGTLLYFSSGAGRGIEVSSVGSFHEFCDYFQEYFNCLRFGMRSEKGINHGVDNNLPVAHYVPASLSRYIVVCNLCLYPAAYASDQFSVPTMDQAPDEADALFRLVMGLENDNRNGKKNNRDFCAQFINFVSPKFTAKVSTTPENAVQFHHSPAVHNDIYSSMIYERDINGRMIPSPLITARIYHNALGEPVNITFRTNNTRRVAMIDPAMFERAIKRALRNPNASCFHEQLLIFNHITNTAINQSVFYKAPMGAGKSCAANIPMLARALAGVDVLRTIVVSPHNTLVAQMKRNYEESFHGTNLQVWAIASSTLETQINSMTDDWDMLIVSIHTLKILLTSHRSVVTSWNAKVIIIDECHLLFEENFRHGTSWSALQDLAALNMKMVLMSGTLNQTTMKILAGYTGMTDYEVIGSPENYTPPNVSINLRRVANHQNLISDLTTEVINKIQHNHSCINTITLSKDDAMTMSDNVNNAGIDSVWLTSECSETQRSERLKDWSRGALGLLASTFNCGTDSSFVNGVEYAGWPRGIAAALQAGGRVRPNNQRGINTQVNIWLDGTAPWNNIEEWNRSIVYMTEAGLFDCFDSPEAKDNAASDLQKLFHSSGFQSIVNGNQCIRQAMLEQIDVTSPNCNMCTHCRRSNPYLRQTALAQQRVRSRAENKQYVLNNMMGLLRQCFVCGEAYCYGTSCLMPNHTRCVKCHGPARQHNAHDPRECKAKHIPLYGRAACILCFLPRAVKEDDGLSSDFPKYECGNLPNAVKCPLGDRVRRILLYDLNAVDDNGTKALNRLESVCTDAELWYERMAINMRMIITNRR